LETIEDTEEKLVDTHENTESVEKEEPEDDKEKNWKAFLQKRKEDQAALEKEREKNKQLEEDRTRRTKELEDMKAAFGALLEKKEPVYNDDEDSEKLIEQKVEKLFSAKEEARKKQEDEKRQQEEMIAVREQMPDLMQVCSQENLLYLEYYHPEIAVPLARMADGFEKTKLAYQAIKKHVKMGTKEKEKIEKNLSKPKSVYSSYSNEGQKEESSAKMSDSKKQEVWNKMQRLISGEDED
jgi:hypothetical protein